MELHIGTVRMNEQENSAALCADVDFGDRTCTLFFSVSQDQKAYLSDETSDAFITALLPYAMVHEMDIICETQASQELLYQLNDSLIPTLARCTERYHRIFVKAPVWNGRTEGTETVTGYSGGVDSLYTVAKHTENPVRLDTLACFSAGVYEDPIERRLAVYQHANCATIEIASELGLCEVGVYSNIQDIVEEHYLSVASYRLIACAMAVSGRVGTFLLSGAYEYDTFSVDEQNVAYYDLLLADCLSTRGLKIYVTGGTERRIDKISYLASANPEIRRHLHVCVKHPLPDEPNCGICSKCIRTEVAVEGLGVMDAFRDAFSWDFYREHHSEIVAKAIQKSGNQHMKEAVDALKSRGYIETDEENRRVRGERAAGEMIRKNREAILRRMQEAREQTDEK